MHHIIFRVSSILLTFRTGSIGWALFGVTFRPLQGNILVRLLLFRLLLFCLLQFRLLLFHLLNIYFCLLLFAALLLNFDLPRFYIPLLKFLGYSFKEHPLTSDMMYKIKVFAFLESISLWDMVYFTTH